MLTIKQLKKELKKFPDSSCCYAYEGEIIGIIVISDSYHSNKELGYITTGESDNFKSETIINEELL